jgi:hypothetical protein
MPLVGADITAIHKDFAKERWRDGVVAVAMMFSIAIIDHALIKYIGELTLPFVYGTVAFFGFGVGVKFGFLNKKDAERFLTTVNKLDERVER